MTWNEYARAKGIDPAKASEVFGDVTDPRFNEWFNSHQRRWISRIVMSGVPDAPFKESWPDLGLKQQLLEAAKDPEAQWIGFTSGQTQAARYDLSKQIGRLRLRSGLEQLQVWNRSGRIRVVKTTVTASQLPDYIGKEAAKKLLRRDRRQGHGARCAESSA